MKQEFTIAISSKLLCFCKKEFFEGRHAPYYIDERSLIGKHILSLLNDARTKQPLISLDVDFELDDDFELNIELSHTLAKRSPTLEKLSHLDIWLENMYQSKLETWVRAQMIVGYSRSQAIRSFIKDYGLNENQFKTAYLYLSRKSRRVYDEQKAVTGI